MGKLIGRFGRIPGLCAAALLALATAPASRADDNAHVFWEITGKHNTVYLLGSVHVLHQDDSALPSVTEGAYRNAEVLVEELDIYAMMGDMFAPELLKQQFLPQGQTLASVLGPELHDKLRAAAKPLGLDMDYLGTMQPWYVATLISSTRLTQAGYSPQSGVDYQIAERAHRDGKPIVGLETAAQQMGFFAAMPMAEQRKFLAASLAENDSVKELRDVTEAWRHGDLAALEKELKGGMDESPELFHRIIVERNQNWLPRIEQMLADPDKDYLVVTGALHMIGPQGLVEQLRTKGYRITRK
jgi:uncharacterized protein YbaP (TraB family)